MQINAFLEGVSRLLSLRNGHLKRFSFIQVNFNPPPKSNKLVMTLSWCLEYKYALSSGNFSVMLEVHLLSLERGKDNSALQ